MEFLIKQWNYGSCTFSFFLKGSIREDGIQINNLALTESALWESGSWVVREEKNKNKNWSPLSRTGLGYFSEQNKYWALSFECNSYKEMENI